ncbi:pleckstrin homology domain-containing family S member 1-like [Megalops cyprinoides]|uniref:pleckstrin homology domain-containing family S member 1-like n=1 Tax=Megalops cyprinoides TaxID=118141 RepID=UPI001864C365|nr:pleckstrin homology domain-containing family S member 1-like [Megalops cyprinoides]
MPGIQKNPAENTVFYRTVAGVQEVRKGYLIKSPPTNQFKSLRSWKRRFFVLFQTREKEYFLKYYKSANDRDKAHGRVKLDQISTIFPRPEHHSRWSWIHKNFKCPPESVLFIQAGERPYFFIDESSGDVDGWYRDISKIVNRSDSELTPERLQRLHRSMPEDGLMGGQSRPTSNRYTALEKLRPMSDPAPAMQNLSFFSTQTCSCRSEADGSSERGTWSEQCDHLNISQDSPYELLCSIKTDTAQDGEKPRSSSEPVPSPLSRPRVQSCSSQLEDSAKARSVSDPVSKQDRSHLRRGSLPSEADSRKEIRSWSEPFGHPNISQDSHYDTPRSILKAQESVDDDDEDEDEAEDDGTSFYMRMDTVFEVVATLQQEQENSLPSCTHESNGVADSDDRPVTSAVKNQKPQRMQSTEKQEKESDRVQSGDAHGDSVERTEPAGAHGESGQVSQVDVLLNRVKSRALIHWTPDEQSHTDSEQQNNVKEIYINRDDLKSNLTLTKIDGMPCVSHWPALPGTQSLFHKGDQILAINDLLTESVDEVHFYLNKLLKNEVKLTIRRQPGSEPFLSDRRVSE